MQQAPAQVVGANRLSDSVKESEARRIPGRDDTHDADVAVPGEHQQAGQERVDQVETAEHLAHIGALWACPRVPLPILVAPRLHALPNEVGPLL